jgi:transposase-like protein
MIKLKALTGKVNRRKTIPVGLDEAKADHFLDFDGKPIDSQHLLISMLLPPAVKEFIRLVGDEVEYLCGKRYEHGTANQRWGSQTGTIVLGKQKVRVEKPRVRNQQSGRETKIPIYERFKDDRLFDEQVFAEGLKKVSQRDFQRGMPKIAASFGFTKSSVSRRWIKATEARLKELNSRDIAAMDIVAVFIDGKRFRDHGVVIALGVSSGGRKYVLGIFECNTENSAACNELLRRLEERGLPQRELLFVVDGGSGLNKSLEDRYETHKPEKRRAMRVRCYVHKWRNIEPNLPEEKQAEAASLFWAIRDAERLGIAEECSKALEGFLRHANLSALESYLEAKDDLLNLHRLRLSPRLRRFFSTTNPLESLNYLTEEDLRRVKKWQNSEHFQRWLAASVLANEKRMRRIFGNKSLPALKAALSMLCTHEDDNLLDKERKIA